MAQERNQVISDSASEAPATPTTAASESATTAELRSQIDRTRAEMSQTIDAIQERLSPSRLMTDAKETVKDATIGRVKRLAHRAVTGDSESGGTEGILTTVENYSFPAALIGVSATAFMMWAFKKFRQDDVRKYRSRSNVKGQRNSTMFLAGTCAGLACWGAWRAQSRRH
jgi:Protein of unknown function (DUF3618)